MSLTDKVIKNTFYHFLAQIVGFIFPLILTPYIISYIGNVQFGIYALVLGFIGTFGLFDLSISSSFIKFISEYYNKKDYDTLNRYINTGLSFYLVFSTLFFIIGYIFADLLLSIINIPKDLHDLSLFVFRLSLVMFFITNSASIFISILISLQKMYQTSILSTLLNFLNTASIMILLYMGYGLKGLLWSQLSTVFLSTLLHIYIAKRELPVLRIGLKYLGKKPLKEMSKFGAQMQLSKLASFASEKYDEFLLAYFSILSNVTYFNLGNRIARFGRFLPFQLIPQVAPIAAELNAKGEREMITQLFSDTTKYLTILTIPIFVFIFTFADTIIYTWMGSYEYYISAHILRILAIGQLINMIFSAPGNSITPNIGIPKFQMHEGLINLGINLILSYLLIKNFGIIGAALGNTIAIITSSLYIYFVSSKFFGKKITELFSHIYFKPIIATVGSAVIALSSYYFIDNFIFNINSRVSGFASLGINGLIFISTYTIWILNFNYIKERDKVIIIKILLKIIPAKFLISKKKDIYDIKKYNNELVSLFVITYNRVEMLKKCVNSLLSTLENVNYELIIWDNNSTDSTIKFLKQFVNNKRIKTILYNKNIGTNAKGKAAELAKGEFIIGIDDDVIDFPSNWVQEMVYAYKTIPNMGYLSTDVVQDETTDGAKQPDGKYEEEVFDNRHISLLVGPAGGWCFMISRQVYEKVGKFYQPKNRIFFTEDEDYANRISNIGLKYGILKGLKVYHATGIEHNKDFIEIFEQKMKDLYKGKPLLYNLKLKFKRIFSLQRYKKKLIELAEKELNEIK